MPEVRGLGFEVSSPSPEIDAAEDDFAVTRIHQRADFAEDAVYFQRAALATDVGNYAEGTAVIASVLDFQVGAGALISRVEDGSGQEFGVGEDVGDEDGSFVVRRWPLATDRRQFMRPSH